MSSANLAGSNSPPAIFYIPEDGFYTPQAGFETPASGKTFVDVSHLPKGPVTNYYKHSKTRIPQYRAVKNPENNILRGADLNVLFQNSLRKDEASDDKIPQKPSQEIIEAAFKRESEVWDNFLSTGIC